MRDSPETAKFAHVLQTLVQTFGVSASEARTVFVPYRVCPLGAHVDHQLGAVTGFALDRGMMLAFAPSGSSTVRLRSMDFEGEVVFDLSRIPPAAPGDWGNYARGAAQALAQRFNLRRGFCGIIAGSLPIGGLSSSAAVGIAYLLALEVVNNLQVQPLENIELDQFIENRYLGLNNGILDQSVILLNEPGKLLFLDCQSREYENIPRPPDERSLDVVIVYSGLSRSLLNTGYNQRVAECQEAARRLLEMDGQPAADDAILRNVPHAVFEKYAPRLPVNLRKRAAHFYSEMERVRRGVDCWREGDLDSFGELMNASCESSIHNYECGAPHLISLYEILSRTPGVYGARFSGGGFRGCCVALADSRYRGQIAEAVERTYPARHPDVADSYQIHFCRLGGGPSIARSDSRRGVWHPSLPIDR